MALRYFSGARKIVRTLSHFSLVHLSGDAVRTLMKVALKKSCFTIVYHRTTMGNPLENHGKMEVYPLVICYIYSYIMLSHHFEWENSRHFNSKVLVITTGYIPSYGTCGAACIHIVTMAFCISWEPSIQRPKTHCRLRGTSV